jgi:hypothetical protein
MRDQKRMSLDSICWAAQLGRLVAVAQNGSGSRVMSSC